MSIESELKKDWEYLVQGKLHEIIGRAYHYAALLSGDKHSFFISLSDSLAPLPARRYVKESVKGLAIKSLKELPFVSEVNELSDEFLEVVINEA